LKEINLASSLRESSNAFYGADAASSCALFYDFQVSGVFMSPDDFVSGTYVLNCGLFSVNVTPTLVNSNVVSNYFQLPLYTNTAQIDDDICAGVEVIKTRVGSNIGDPVNTTIKSRAVNGACNRRKAIMVERGLQVDY
jgi:hypothetical protein